MGKLYDKYLKFKNVNSGKIYLFRNGVFYIMIASDADSVGPQLGLRLTNLNDQVKKCGFPIKSFEKYKSRLETLELEYEIIEDKDRCGEIINNELYQRVKYIREIDLNKITPIEALTVLNGLQEIIKND